jgi:hypothetical protein
MNKKTKAFLTFLYTRLPIWVIVIGTSILAGKFFLEWESNRPFRFPRESEVERSDWTLASPAKTAEFIDGPLAANIGELCVFRLNDTATKADWAIIPQSTFYVDSGKNSICFASTVAARYTIIAAIVENGEAKILLHFCDYGGAVPNPSPGPTPIPLPKPETLKDWVTQNKPAVPDTALAALATCYRSAAEGIEKGAFKTQTSASSALRTATQTKIKPEVWGDFLDKLETQITEKLAGSSEVKKLGELFEEVADGLRLQTSDIGLQEGLQVSSFQTFLKPEARPSDAFPEARCLEPYCKPSKQFFRR